MNAKTYLTAAQSSKLLKKTLRAAFKGTKFSVRLDNGTTCRVSWVDGPSIEKVEAIANRFQGKRFDGMTDCESYVEAMVDQDGEKVRSGLGYVFSYREISDELAAEYAEKCQAAMDEAEGFTSCNSLATIDEERNLLLEKSGCEYFVWVDGYRGRCCRGLDQLSAAVAGYSIDIDAERAAQPAAPKAPAKSLDELVERYAS